VVWLVINSYFVFRYTLVVKRAVWDAIILCASTLVIVGCQYDHSASNYLTTAPKDRDIVGRYVLDAASRKKHIALPMSGAEVPINSSATIILSEDHTAQFVGVPADNGDGKESCVVTGRGSWTVSLNSGNYYAVDVRIHNEEKNSPCGYEFNWPLMLYGNQPPYKLHQIFDDPDLGDFVQFEKQLG
jgi:hypothetical protein